MFVLLLIVDSNDSLHNGIQILNNINGYLISVLRIMYSIILVHVSSKKVFHGKIKPSTLVVWYYSK